MGRGLAWLVGLTSEGSEEVEYDISPQEMSIMVDTLEVTDPDEDRSSS
jgi:hypothetical protein